MVNKLTDNGREMDEFMRSFKQKQSDKQYSKQENKASR